MSSPSCRGCTWRVSGIGTGIDLSKILGGQTKIFGEAKGDKCMGVSQLLGVRARAAPSKSTPMGTGLGSRQT